MALLKKKDVTNSISSEITQLLTPILSTYKKNIDLLVAPFGITAGQPPILLLLLSRDGLCQREVSDLLNVRPASVTTMLCRLEKSGFVSRVRDDNDHRVIRVYLTNKGKKSTRKLQAITRFVNERNLAGFRNEEKILLLRLLEQMKGNLDTALTELELIKYDKSNQ